MADKKSSPPVIGGTTRDPEVGMQTNPSDSLISDGYLAPDLPEHSGYQDRSEEPPPAYGEHPDQMQFSQPGFEAGAAVTGTFKTDSAAISPNQTV